MTQTILNFKLGSTDEKLTPRAGVAIFGEYFKGMGLESFCNKDIVEALKKPTAKLEKIVDSLMKKGKL